ncbi:MAG: efflux RND transporter periplasmic adaptor subunit, partial [Verrucomicrobiota bacterium]
PEVTISEERMEVLEENRGMALRAVLSFVLVLVILGLMAVTIATLIATKPEAEKEDDLGVVLPLVSVAEVEKTEEKARIFAEGVVESGRVVALTAEVSGRIVEVSRNLNAGGQVREGEVLARIEAADYQAALEQAKSAVADAALVVEQEEAKREQALRDWEQLGRGEPSDLLVRKPQLASARARLASAEAEVKRAERNLERTVIRSPFDAVVRQEAVEVGAVLLPGTQLVTLFSTKSLEVELPLKLEDYAVLERDEFGKPQGGVVFSAELGAETIEWPGRIVRTTGEVERGALTAGVVVAVNANEEGVLPPPGLFVKAELEGEVVKGFFVPRQAVRDGSKVMVVDGEGAVEIRDLSVVRTAPEAILVKGGVVEGERVILTRLGNVVSGMKVEVEESAAVEMKGGK